MKISKKRLEEIILQEFNKIISESKDNLEGFENLPESEAIEKIRSMDPEEVTASTVSIFMKHPSSIVKDYVERKFKTLKSEDPPELLGVKIFLAYPDEGEGEPLKELAQELGLDIEELPSEKEIEEFQKRLNDQEEEYDDDFPTNFTSGGSGGGMDPLMIYTKVGRFDESVYYLSPYSGPYTDTLVGTYRKLSELYKYPYEQAEKIEAVRGGIEKLLDDIGNERTNTG